MCAGERSVCVSGREVCVPGPRGSSTAVCRQEEQRAGLFTFLPTQPCKPIILI